MSDADEVLRVATLKALATYTAARYEEARAEQTTRMRRGDRLTARDPRDDGKIASLSYTDPKPVVEVNLPVLTEWVAAEYPALCDTVTEIAPGMEQVVHQVLFEHRPDLLVQRTRIAPDALREMRAACASLGRVMGPGGETDVPGLSVRTPEGHLSCRFADDAEERVISLVREGRVQIDGTMRPAIEAGEQP